MKLKELFAVVVVMFLSGASQHAYGQAEKTGNGGDVVICENGEHTFYDLFEANDRGINIVPTGSKNFRDGIGKMLDRLKKIDPIRYELYTQTGTVQANFITDMLQATDQIDGGNNDAISVSKNLLVTRFKNAEIKDIPDEGLVTLPNECSLHQLMVQTLVKDYLGFDQIFTVDLNKWAKLNADNRAAAVMHELIYREAAAKGHKNSRYVRVINQMIAADFSRVDFIGKILSIDESAARESLPKMQYRFPTKMGSFAVETISLSDGAIVLASWESGVQEELTTNQHQQKLTTMDLGKIVLDSATFEIKAYVTTRDTNYDRLLFVVNGQRGQLPQYHSLTFNVSFDIQNLVNVTTLSATPRRVNSCSSAREYIYDKDLKLRLICDDQLKAAVVDQVKYKNNYAIEFDAKQRVVGTDSLVKINEVIKKLLKE